MLVDPRREAVLIAPKGAGRPEDVTATVAEVSPARGGRVAVRFAGGRTYHYGPDRVRVLTHPREVRVAPGARVAVDGLLQGQVHEVWAFADGESEWWHLFSRRADGGEQVTVCAGDQVDMVEDAAAAGQARAVLEYLRQVVSRLPADDPLRPVYEALTFVRPGSALARWSSGDAIDVLAPGAAALFPFRRNLSQWDAVTRALTHPVSVIDGPPGTGKTETILNVVASLVAGGAGTVGVVSFSNAAVDNVREKMVSAGLGHVVAALGNRDNRDAFFRGQPDRNAALERLLAAPPVPAERLTAARRRLARLDTRLRRLHEDERRRAQLRSDIAAYALERDHFRTYLRRQALPSLDDVPLLRRSSRRLVRFLVETQAEHGTAPPGLVRRVVRWLRYGSLGALDPGDTDLVLAVQSAFYDRRLAELRRDLDRVDASLTGADVDALAAEHRALSLQVLHGALDRRYRAMPRRTYRHSDYRRGPFPQFVRDYPVLLSSCHSLARSLADGYLLDHLVIDEASQVDLLTAAAAMACCRNLVVVGDLQQLAPIATGAADGLAPPAAAYDYGRHSILSSVIALYGDRLPRTLLREHYRCDPAIIQFCNKSFYQDQLIPFTTGRVDRPMIVAPTTPGNHMRRHRDGGRTNQRELDVILQEILPQYCRDVPAADIGITTPYRKQVDKAADMLDRQEIDTVHRFQGRQKRIVVLSAVIDDSWRGRTGLGFVDDPRLVNVAVSRAVERFVLVTDSRLMPASRHLRDLIAYVRYLDPGRPLPESTVVSVFDLLYREYSALLRPFARRVRGTSRYRSENIVDTLLDEILTRDYPHVLCARQVLLRHLVADLTSLTPQQQTYVRNRASLDFVLYNRVSNAPILAVEVNGFAFHENDPRQQARDRLKQDILRRYGLPLLPLPTTGSGEAAEIRRALRQAGHEPHSAGDADAVIEELQEG